MMLGMFLGAVLAAMPLASEGLEQEATRFMREQSARASQAPPEVDAQLTRAAQRLARQSLAMSGAQAPDPLRSTEAVGEEGGAALITSTVAVIAGVPSHALELLQEQGDRLGVASSLLGVGVAEDAGKVALVVLKGERFVALRPFPRTFAEPGRGDVLCGELQKNLGVPVVHVTRPDGSVERVRLTRNEGRSFCVGLDFPQAGIHTVTVTAGRWPALNLAGSFRVRVGQASPEVEPEGRDSALQAVVRRINALRKGEGLPAVKRDASLDRVAQAYADRMAREGFYGPMAPDGTTVAERLLDYGGGWTRGAENLGWGAGPIAAHFGIEHTNQSRRNLLDPEMRAVGLGLAWKQGEGGKREARLVEVMMPVPPGTLAPEGPVEETYRLVERMRPKKLKPLVRSQGLEALAAEVARTVKGAGEVTDVALYERALKEVPTATSASATVYEVPDVLALPRPAVLVDPATSHVGVAVVRVSDDGSGAPLYRVVVFSASRSRTEVENEVPLENVPDKMMGVRKRVN
ncbi:hypothetical protein JY651_14670 [Pyxidicoccus parkwayensis]|uniref:SCP domain-containing protein n=1 Tax=Pyxidicoccus parkwayensis TaxID=2813578 RepID=A0ABX7P6K7_9BACT|nr:CAP domain-containing protein [Pyxidicoccus parkwaysis]QSQ26088.1 hypothetical protein JY651_14670 [Pyxidicoccus parkwaysis]